MQVTSKGNVLFLILIAVGLFAALTYAVSSSMRGGDTTITKEQARIASGEILRSMQSIKQGYDYLWNQKGCSIDEISFVKTDREVSAEDFDALDPKSDDSCDIFSISGGGISYPDNLSKYQDETLTSAEDRYGKLFFYYPGLLVTNPTNARIEDLGTDTADIFIEFSGVTQDICIAVNKQLNYDDYTNDFIDPYKHIGNEYADFEGRHAGCRARAAGGQYDVFYVIQEM